MNHILALLLPAFGAVAAAYVLFRYFNRKARDPRPAPTILTLTADASGFTVTDSRKIKSLDVPWQDVGQVTVIRTDKGPFDDSLFYHVVFAGGHITLPAGANNAQAFREQLMALPGFDRAAYDAALTATANNTFSRIFRA